MDIKIRIIRSRAPRLLYGAIFAVSPALINYQPARIQMKTGFGKGEDDIGLLADAYKNQPGHSQSRSKGAFRRWHGYFAHFSALPQNADCLPNPRKHDLAFHLRSG